MYTLPMFELALRRIRENKDKHARGEDASFLDLGNCGLTKVPQEIGELVWLEGLSLSSEWWEWDGEERTRIKTDKRRPRQQHRSPARFFVSPQKPKKALA